MKAQCRLVPWSVVACLTLITSGSARADDYDACMQGLVRYQSHVPELEDARAQCAAEEQQIRSDPTLTEDQLEVALQQQCPAKQGVCNKIGPEMGHAACEAFLQSGAGDGTQLASAQEANTVLKSLYDECTAQ